MAIVYLSLGSNKGDRIGYIQQATSILDGLADVSLVRTSAFYESEPWHTDTKNWFVNAMIEIKTSLNPYQLLKTCQKVEDQLGRDRENEGHYGGKWGALCEVVAETNAIGSAVTNECSDEIILRAEYLQENFPKTIAEIKNAMRWKDDIDAIEFYGT